MARTPITQFKTGALSKLSAPKLGSIAISGVLNRAKLEPTHVQEVFFGQVLQAGSGQAPARQAALGAGLPKSVICSTINKVCASGMKSIMLAAQSIKLGDADVVVAGGMESMSKVPWFLERPPKGLGHLNLLDGILHDGLTDAYGNYHMGICAENTCTKYDISRQQQDEYAIASYKRSDAANKIGLLASEIVPVELSSKSGSVTISEDEEFKRIDFAKLASLKPAFDKSGSVTAANASTLNDGAAATLLMSAMAVEQHKLEPLAEIVAYADAACEPIDFPIAPALSIPKVSFVQQYDKIAQAVEYDVLQSPRHIKINALGN